MDKKQFLPAFALILPAIYGLGWRVSCLVRSCISPNDYILMQKLGFVICAATALFAGYLYKGNYWIRIALFMATAYVSWFLIALAALGRLSFAFR